MEEPEASLERPGAWERLRLVLPGLAAQGSFVPAGTEARSAVAPLGIALVAILVPAARGAVLLVALAGFLLERRRGSVAAWSWAAVLPLATILAWSLLPAPAPLPDAGSCASLLSPPAVWRVAELAVVLGAVAAVSRLLGDGHRHLPLARGEGWFVALAAAAGFAMAPVALLLGTVAARPFFGAIHLETGLAGAIVPAIAFASANAILEETVYRGALLGWLERNLGTVTAIVVQALAFGLAHMGPDFISSPLPILLTVASLGLLGGVVVKRTGSLLVPIVVHAAFDIPLYYNLACRVS